MESQAPQIGLDSFEAAPYEENRARDEQTLNEVAKWLVVRKCISELSRTHEQ